jgi:hypothetical protein
LVLIHSLVAQLILPGELGKRALRPKERIHGIALSALHAQEVASVAGIGPNESHLLPLRGIGERSAELKAG